MGKTTIKRKGCDKSLQQKSELKCWVCVIIYHGYKLVARYKITSFWFKAEKNNGKILQRNLVLYYT